jgi:hypothetical protein
MTNETTSPRHHTDPSEIDLDAEIERTEQDLASRQPDDADYDKLAQQLYRLLRSRLLEDIKIEQTQIDNWRGSEDHLTEMKRQLRELDRNQPKLKPIDDSTTDLRVVGQQYNGLNTGIETSQLQQQIAELGDFAGSGVLEWSGMHREGSVVSDETLARIESRALDLLKEPESAQSSLTFINDKIQNGESLTPDEIETMNKIEKFKEQYKIPLDKIEASAIADIMSRKIPNTTEGALMLLEQINDTMSHYYLAPVILNRSDLAMLEDKVEIWRQTISQWIKQQKNNRVSSYDRDFYEKELGDPIYYTNSTSNLNYDYDFDSTGYVAKLQGDSIDADSYTGRYFDAYGEDFDDVGSDETANLNAEWYDPDQDWLTNVREIAPDGYSVFGLSQDDLAEIESLITSKATDRYVSSAGLVPAMLQSEWSVVSGGREFMQEPREMVAMGLESMRWLYSLDPIEYEKFDREIHRLTKQHSYAFESKLIQELWKMTTGTRLHRSDATKMYPAGAISAATFGKRARLDRGAPIIAREREKTRAIAGDIKEILKVSADYRRDMFKALSDNFNQYQDDAYHFKRCTIGGDKYIDKEDEQVYYNNTTYRDSMIMVNKLIEQLSAALLVATIESAEPTSRPELIDGKANRTTD